MGKKLKITPTYALRSVINCKKIATQCSETTQQISVFNPYCGNFPFITIGSLLQLHSVGDFSSEDYLSWHDYDYFYDEGQVQTLQLPLLCCYCALKLKKRIARCETLEEAWCRLTPEPNTTSK